MKINRWDNNDTLFADDSDPIAKTLEAANKLGISCFRANLVGANLVGANLVGANLDSANLDGANLVGANLDSANLDGANLVGANLVGANLVGANLVGANLDSANLVGANLVGANLVGANLVRANLVGANLVRANLPIYCKWTVSYRINPTVVSIGCKTKTITEWDAWFAGSDEFETPRNCEEFKRIKANYLAVRAYLVEMGEVAS